jgi:putative endonuclease
MYFIYSIYNSKHDKFYVGQTVNLDDRIRLHNNHEFKHCYTSRFDGEWVLVCKEEVLTRQDALKREAVEEL